MTSNHAGAILEALREGNADLKGEFMWGSNYTFLLQIEHAGLSLQAVYKPTRGVRPLWDFPSNSLARREVAAYLVSEALGWQLVPPTVLRKNAPLGPGSLQLFIEHNPEYHYFNFTAADRQRLQRQLHRQQPGQPVRRRRGCRHDEWRQRQRHLYRRQRR